MLYIKFWKLKIEALECQAQHLQEHNKWLLNRVAELKEQLSRR